MIPRELLNSTPGYEPAFPTPERSLGSGGDKTAWYWNGVTTRDYFAAAALKGIIANPNFGFSLDNLAVLANNCYVIADSMVMEKFPKEGEK